MTLPALYNVPKDALDLQWWSFHHADEHILISREILRAKNKRIELYPIDPVPLIDVSNWLRRHQTMHNDVNAILGTNGSDLTSLDIENEDQVRAWIYLDAQEHYLWRQELGI